MQCSTVLRVILSGAAAAATVDGPEKNKKNLGRFCGRP
jgi:hypothetical protein